MKIQAVTLESTANIRYGNVCVCVCERGRHKHTLRLFWNLMERKQQIGTFKWKEHTKHGNLNSDAETSNQKEPTNEFLENRGKKTGYNNAKHCIYTPNETKYKITVSALMHLIWCVCVQREDENGMKQNGKKKNNEDRTFFCSSFIC